MARLRLEPWPADYEGALRTDSDALPAETVQLDVEVNEHEWQPLAAKESRDWPTLLFVDGSRRMEARVHLEDEGGLHAHGGLGTTGVGAVRVQEGRKAEFWPDLRIGRWCLIGSGQLFGAVELEQKGNWRTPLRFEQEPVADSTPDSIMQGLQSRMRQEEALLAGSLLQAEPDALVICDGPLPLHGPRQALVGYIKTTSVQRLKEEQLRVARNLKAGERTPVYLVGQGALSHFEWILRLRNPEPWYYSLAGTVRLQVAAGEASNLSEFARQVADWSCVQLPRYSSQAHQDPRAPQQLLPVRALERELKRRMGDSQLIRRRIVREYFA